MTNLELMNSILLKAEEEHINLYHDVKKEEVRKHISLIKNINELSPVEFDGEMLKLFALFKDAHTSYSISNQKLNKKLRFVQNKFFIRELDESSKKDYVEVKKIAGLTASFFVKKIEPYINYETKEWLNVKIDSLINNGYFYDILKLKNDGKIFIETKEGQIIEVGPYIQAADKQIKDPPMLYEYKLFDNILYLRYSKCDNDFRLPFKKLVKMLAKQIKKFRTTNYILDLRNNTGGHSEILNPFQKLVRKRKLNGVLLINNAVFSSGKIAVVRFKKEFNTPLIGEPTGSPAKSYGHIKHLKVENKEFIVSTKFWDFSDIFGYDGAIQPDVLIQTTMEDIKTQKDRVLDYAIEFLKNRK